MDRSDPDSVSSLFSQAGPLFSRAGLDDPSCWQGKKIGLLGGSFNPAHAGHLDISRAALDLLELDAVWWLIAPQNPLKETDDRAPLARRRDNARAWLMKKAPDQPIYVSDLEQHLETRYTVDSLAALVRLCPGARFVWLMGADNMDQFAHWKDWKTIADTVVFAIFDRPGYSGAIKTSAAAVALQDYQIPEEQAATLVSMKAPAWVAIRVTQNPLSSTDIRRKNFNNQEVACTLPNKTKSEDGSSSLLKSSKNSRLLAVILHSLEEDKAEDIITIDLKGKSSIADSMIIVSGRSTRQVAAIADHLITSIKQNDGGTPRVEGLQKADWVLVDAGDVIVHIFRPEVRSFYNLEKMWAMDIGPDDFTPGKITSP